MGNQRQPLAEIARIAAGQHGHVTRKQLRAVGISERTIDRRIQDGTLIRVHAGVYAVGYPRVEPRRLTDRQLTRAIQDSRHARHIRPPELDGLLRTCPRARALVDPTQNPTRSGLEDDFLRWIRRYGLPMPTINVKASGKEVDAWFHAERVVLEVDSWEYHGDPITFRSDAERGTAHAANGLLPLRLTGDRLTAVEAERLHGILARRR